MENSKPLISIVIPVYNLENYILECVDSLQCQDFKNFEIILVNDGSSDNSQYICESIQSKYGNVKLINKKNQGVSAARRDGALQSIGSYICFIDGDDWVSNDYFEQLKNILFQYDCDIICFGMRVQNINGDFFDNYLNSPKGLYQREEIVERIFPKILSDKDGCIFTPSLADKCIKRELCINNLFYNSKAVLGEDGAVSIPCIYYASTIYVLDKCIYTYRYNNCSTTKSKKVYSWDFPYIVNSYLKDKISLDLYDFKGQFARKVVHDIFTVIISQFYRDDSYNIIVRDIKKNLNNTLFKQSLEVAQFKRFNKFYFMAKALRLNLFFLFKLYSLIK